MQASTIRDVAELMAVGAEGPDSGGWMSLNCPFAPFKHRSGRDRKPSMRVEVRPGGVSRWRCWSCGEGGTLIDVILTLKHYQAGHDFGTLMQMATKEENEIEFTIFQDDGDVQTAPAIPEEWLNQFKYAWQTAAGGLYLKSRGIPLMTQMAWDLRYDVANRRLIFPIRDRDDILRGVQGRAIDPAMEPKYLHYKYPDFEHGQVWGSQFWLNEQRLDFDKPIVLGEGGFDGLKISMVYSNVAIGMGGAVQKLEKMDRLATAMKIITFFDADDGGDHAREWVARWCKGKRICRHVKAPDGMDPGELEAGDIRALLAEHLDPQHLAA